MSQSLMRTFLNELSSGDLKERIDQMEAMLEYLENKNDPEPSELQLVDSIYRCLEAIKVFESTLRNHVTRKSSKLTGNMLQGLYDQEPKNVGTQKLFD
jgi:hypothetical protein